MEAGQPGLCGQTLSHAYSYLPSAPSPLASWNMVGGVSLSSGLDNLMRKAYDRVKCQSVYTVAQAVHCPPPGHIAHTHYGTNGASFPSEACTSTQYWPLTHCYSPEVGSDRRWPTHGHT